MIKNNVSSYGNVTKIFHWLMVILFIAMFTIGYVMTNIPKSNTRLTLYDMHKSTGLVMFSLFVLRLGWRLINIQPLLPSVKSRLHHFVIQTNVCILYCLMAIIPITGFLISVLGGHEVSVYYLFTLKPFAVNETLSGIFSSLHLTLGYMLIAIVFLHICGAMYHQFKIKDGLLNRIWFRNRNSIQC